MNIVAYCRVSTDKSDQLNSIETQKTFFEEYSAKHGYNLVTIYADEGISGTKIKNRTQFQRLLRDAKHGLFDMVVVKDISRFARNTVDLLSSTRQLKELGIETTFLTANMSVLGQSEFVLTIFGALAQEESANTSKRVKFGKKMNAQKGRVPNMVFGYDKTKGDYFSLTINEFEAGVVRNIYDLYLNSGYGANKIAQVLNAEGIRTKRECRWSQNAVCRILTNEIYTGKIINGKEEITDFLTSKREKKDESDWYIVDKPELRIISDEAFVNTQKLLSDRNIAFSTNKVRQSNKHLFSTIIRCKCCGYSFRRVEKQYKNLYVRWVCSGRNANGKESCPNIYKLSEDELKTALRDFFADMLDNHNAIITNIVREFNRNYHTKEDNQEQEKELNERLLKANKARKKYMDMYEDDIISRVELREKVAHLNTEIERCENELKLTSYNLSKGEQLESVLSTTFKRMDSMVDVENITNQQLKEVIDKISIDEHGRIDVYLKLLSDIGLEQSILLSHHST